MRDPGHFDLTECGFIVIEDKSCRYELDAEGSVLRYRSIISPTLGGMDLPQTFFAEKRAEIPEDMMARLTKAILAMLEAQDFEYEQDILPPGASSDAYMSIFYNGRTLYYSNAHSAADDSFSVITKPVPQEFSRLIGLLDECRALPFDIVTPDPSEQSFEGFDGNTVF